MRLQDELERIADNAPQLGHDAADRALRSAHRRRRYVQAPLLAAAIAIAVIGGLATRPTLFSLDLEPAKPWGEPAKPWEETIEIPATADPLPAAGVGKARLAYVWSCGPSQAVTPDCVEARIMTQDNEHWAIPDASPTRGKEGAFRQEAITVSPNGELIAYTRENWFVLRDLASGTVTPLFEFEATTYNGAMWSPDSTRVAFNLTVGDHRSAKLVDFTRGRVTATLDNGWPLGLPNGDALIPVANLPAPGAIPLVDRTGARRGSIPASALGDGDPVVRSGVVSPDGRRAALVMAYPADAAEQLSVVGIDPPTDSTKGLAPTPGTTWHPTVLGWLDSRHFMLATDHVNESPLRQELTVNDVDAVDTIGTTTRTNVVGYTIERSLSVATDLL